MSENIKNIKEIFKVSLEPSSNAYKILLVFDELGLLNPKIIEVNTSLFACIERICSDDYFKTLFGLAAAVPEEFDFMACLAFEGFSPWGDLKESLIEEDKIDVEKTRAVFENKYSKFISFEIFQYGEFIDFKEQDFEPTNLPRLLLQILHNHCGNSEQALQSFYEKQFQNYLNCLGAFILFTNDKNSSKLIKAFNDNYKLDFPIQAFQTEVEFNKYVEGSFLKYLDLITQLTREFSFQRQLTINVIESHLMPIINENYEFFEIKKTPSLSSFDELNSLLSEIYSKTEINLVADVKKKLREYLDKDYSSLKAEGGFINLIVNQHNLLIKHKKFQEGTQQPKSINVATEKELIEISEDSSITLDYIAVVNRLKFIITNIDDNLDPDEKSELWEKLAGIVSSKSATFYSDIFELYAYTLLKTKKVPIKLLKSQVKAGNKISTCDYKIGDDFAADCKCIISSSAEFHQISEHSSKIGKQIKSTLGYENISFGGGIIGYRDRNFDFLKPFSEYNGDEKSKLLILNFIINCYSEFRRHTEIESQEKIKFILVYYLPNSDIKPVDIINLTPDSVESKNEIFFLLTTKYATADEIEKITNAFKTVTPMIFQFNNYLN